MAIDEQLLNRGGETDQSESDDEPSADDSQSGDDSQDGGDTDMGGEAEEPEELSAAATDQGSAERAGALRSAVQAEKNGLPPESSGNIRTDKRNAARNQGVKGKAKKMISAALSPIKKGLAKLLQAAWKNLISSWGLTLLWIDIHVFGGYVFGTDTFCHLGEEWKLDAPPLHVGVNENSVKIPSEQAGKAVGLIETMGCGCLNCGCLLLIFCVLVLISLLLKVVDNPLYAAGILIGWFWKIVDNIGSIIVGK